MYALEPHRVSSVKLASIRQLLARLCAIRVQRDTIALTDLRPAHRALLGLSLREAGRIVCLVYPGAMRTSLAHRNVERVLLALSKGQVELLNATCVVSEGNRGGKKGKKSK